MVTAKRHSITAKRNGKKTIMGLIDCLLLNVQRQIFHAYSLQDENKFNYTIKPYRNEGDIDSSSATSGL